MEIIIFGYQRGIFLIPWYHEEVFAVDQATLLIVDILLHISWKGLVQFSRGR